MSIGHILKYHVAIPVTIFGVLALVGVPLGTAFVVGMMAGCGSMMLLMVTSDRDASEPRLERQDQSRR